MARSQRKFTDEFKRETIRLAEQPKTNVSRAAQDLGIPTAPRQNCSSVTARCACQDPGLGVT